MINDEKILITGAMGFIGKSLFNFLESSNEVMGIDKLVPNDSRINQIDLVNYKDAFNVISDFSPSIIFHLGTNSAGHYNHNFLDAYDEDSRSLRNILYTLKEYRHIKLIFMSSSYVYSGVDSSKMVGENVNLSPSHNFGISKLFFENLIERNCKEYVIYRLSNVLGFGNQINKTAVMDWFQEATKCNEIVVWGKGKRKLQYIAMDDLLNILAQGLNIPNGIYNLGSENYKSMKYVSSKIGKITNSRVVFLDEKPEGYSLPFMSLSKLDKIINYVHKDFDESLLEFYKKMSEDINE